MAKSNHLLVYLAGAFFLTTTVVSSAVEVTLNDEDQDVLRRIANIEKAAGASQTILAWAPLVSLVTSEGLAEFTFTFVTNDWDEHARAIGALEKIKSCSISEVITIHLLEVMDPAKTEFFEAIEKPYAAKCTS